MSASSARLLSPFLTSFALLLAAPAFAVTIDWVTVGDPGNPADTATNCFAANCGSVAEVYRISKTEVTNAQYAEFLNLKAASDPLGLYNTSMGSNAQGGITRSGSSGSFSYAVKLGFADKPVNYVSFYDSLRFTNWLNNGQGSADTDTGAYTITAQGITNNTITRNAGANIFLPSENEWYKAAYYNPAAQSFFDFPAGTDVTTVCAAPGATANTANCLGGIGGVTNVGAFAGSASPNGTFDQGGNVWEWNEQIVSGSGRGLRGGTWNGPASRLAASDPGDIVGASLEASSVGFRVASLVPEPGTSLLVMIGLAGLAARQERRKRNL